MIHLKTLNLSYTSISGNSFHYLRDFQQLKIIDISYCYHIDDRAIKNLSKLKNLIKISLSGCNNITDIALRYLRTLPKLRYLSILECDQITSH